MCSNPVFSAIAITVSFTFSSEISNGIYSTTILLSSGRGFALLMPLNAVRSLRTDQLVAPQKILENIDEKPS